MGLGRGGERESCHLTAARKVSIVSIFQGETQSLGFSNTSRVTTANAKWREDLDGVLTPKATAINHNEKLFWMIL